MRQLKIPHSTNKDNTSFEEYLSKAHEREAEIERLRCVESENLARLKDIAQKNKEQDDDDKIHRYLKYFSKCSELGYKDEFPYAYAENNFEKRTGLKDGAHVRYKDRGEEILKLHIVGHSDPRGILDLETIYEIEYIVIGRSYGIVKLVGFREEEFSAGLFEAIDKTEPKKCLKAGGSVRYIGASERSFHSHGGDFCSDPRSILNLDATYEVEWVGKHPCYCGHRVIKLVGFEKELFHRIWFEKVVN